MGIFDVLPRTAETRDGRLTIAHVVVPVTGAYGYAFSDNSNGARRPPVVLCREGAATLAVRRETFHDLLARNVR